jgi:hypothetical protein
VARAISRIIFKNQGPSCNFCGLRLDFKERQGLSTNIAGISLARNYFLTRNSVDLVHHLWTGQRGSGPWWTEAVHTRGRVGARAHRCLPVAVEGMSWMRQFQRGPHRSTSGDGEAMRR